MKTKTKALLMTSVMAAGVLTGCNSDTASSVQAQTQAADIIVFFPAERTDSFTAFFGCSTALIP